MTPDPDPESFRWDPDQERFRDDRGRFVPVQEVVRKGDLRRDETGRFRLRGSFVPADALPNRERTATTQTGEVVDINEAIREGRVQQDEHGLRLDGRFISRETLRQGATVRGPVGDQEAARRLVLVRPDGEVVLIRAGGSDTDTDTAEEVVASGISSAAIQAGIISVGEYEQLGRMNTARLVREMAVVDQDLTTL